MHGARDVFPSDEHPLNQETSHLTTLRSLNLNIGANVFKFPDDTFQSASNMLAFGEKLEGVFIGAYLGAIKVAASANSSLGIFVAEAAAQILGIECEHRVLIRDIAGQDPPNNRNYEGDLQAPNGVLGNTGTGSTVYASGDAAVGALVGPGGLGISIVS